MNQTLVRTNGYNPLREGDKGPTQVVNLPASRKLNIKGKVELFHFLDDMKKPASLVIEGQRIFNQDNEIDRHNWRVLQLLLKSPGHEGLAERLILVDPDKDARAMLERNDWELELRQLISERKSDTDFLSKLYRRVIGISSGIAPTTMLVGLLTKAKEDVMAFRTTGKDTKWVFEDDYFETEALLDASLDRGLLIRIGDSIRRKDGHVLGLDRNEALHTLRKDAEVKHFLQSKLSRPVDGSELNTRERAATVNIEDDELADMASGLGEATDELPINPNGGVDETIMEKRKQERADLLVNNLMGAGYIENDGTSLKILDLPGSYETMEQLKGMFLANEPLMETYEGLLA